MRRGVVLLVLVIALLLAFGGCELLAPDVNNSEPVGPADPGSTNGDPPQEPDIRTATIVAVGDIMGHLTQIQQARVVSAEGTVTYDFSPSFDIIAPYLMNADLTVGNLETTLAGSERGYSGYPNFNTPVELAANLKAAGFDLLATSNNHSLDMGLSGLKKTIENIRAAGLQNFGTYLTVEEQQAPLIVDLNGIKVAFLAYTKTTNGIPVPAGHSYAVNFLPDFRDVTPMLENIKGAREAGADIVALYLHWGHEYHFTPAEYQRNLAVVLAEAGADLIFGSHPHVIQPMEWITVDKGERIGQQVMVAYSMGNFISNQHLTTGVPSAHTKAGLLVQVELQKDMDTGLTIIRDASYEITWVHRDWRHRILPTSEVMEKGPEAYNLNQTQFNKLKDSHTQMKAVVEKYAFSTRKTAELP